MGSRIKYFEDQIDIFDDDERIEYLRESDTFGEEG